VSNFTDYGDLWLAGLWGTVTITILAFALAFALGLVVATFRVSPIPPLRWVGVIWVEVLRNIPLTVLLFVFFFGFPKVGIKYSSWLSAIIVCGAYTSVFIAETVRSGFNAVPPGQAEAARALGLTFPQVLTQVVWPQAIRSVVPPLGSVFIALTKNSALALTIGAIELTGTMQDIGNRTAQWFPLFFGTATAYLLLTLPSGQLIALIERKVAIRR
jgi:glutamate transport system permease protein